MNEFARFRDQLLRVHPLVTHPEDQDYLFQVAKKCALVTGIPMGGALGIATMGSGMIVVPGVGALPGWFVGAMGGFLVGTSMCMIANLQIREQIDLILK